ncbi:50S ribosomal protein L21, partial [Candidatus Shapirobacteria bacterium CG10_big_fil_rev_8_21_14_0_10_36_6]
VVDDDKIEIGNPTVKNATVEYQIINQYQGDKVRVSKFKAKSRYRKTIGFRAQLTDIKIIKINL